MAIMFLLSCEYLFTLRTIVLFPVMNFFDVAIRFLQRCGIFVTLGTHELLKKNEFQ